MTSVASKFYNLDLHDLIEHRDRYLSKEVTSLVWKKVPDIGWDLPFESDSVNTGFLVRLAIIDEMTK